MLHTPTYECLLFDGQGHRIDFKLRNICSMEDYAVRNAPLINSPSGKLLELVKKRLGLENARMNIVRYPMSLPEEIPSPPGPREKLEDMSFLYFGRIEPRKGLENLVLAFNRMPELRLTIIGSDTRYDPYGNSFLEYLKKTVSGNVTFRNAIPRDKLLSILKQFDVCVFPSLFENFPNACIEAMANSRIVIAGNNGGMAEMIEHGNTGFLVEASDPENIVRVIEEDLADHLPRLEEIALNAAKSIRKLVSPENYAARLQNIIETARRDARGLSGTISMTPKVSIIIPFYKEIEYIDYAVDSAVSQEYENTEILIVNDGSPLKEAKEKLEKVAARDGRIRIVNKENGGLASARNKGIRESSGEYILFLDADDRIRGNYAGLGVEILERRKELYALAPYAAFVDAETGKEKGIFNPMPFHRTTALVINQFGASGSFFRKELFTEKGVWYDEVLTAYEDWAIWLDMARLGLQWDVLPRVCYDYRVRKGSMMHETAWPNHTTLVGLLIHRHFPALSEDEKEILTLLNHVWAGGVLKGISSPLRHKIVDRLAAMAKKIPGLSRLLRRMGEIIFKSLGG